MSFYAAAGARRCSSLLRGKRLCFLFLLCTWEVLNLPEMRRRCRLSAYFRCSPAILVVLPHS